MTKSTVFVVDDDTSSRESLGKFLRNAGFAVECFDCADQFLSTANLARGNCLVLDVNMPGMSGPELQTELIRRGSHLPIIFLTGYGDIPTTVRAMKKGAVDFLTKPVNAAELLKLIQSAASQNSSLNSRYRLQAELRQRLSTLTPREKEILKLAIDGIANKEIALCLNVSYRTVETHRSHIFAKTKIQSLLEFTHLLTQAGSTLDEMLQSIPHDADPD